MPAPQGPGKDVIRWTLALLKRIPFTPTVEVRAAVAPLFFPRIF